MFDLMTPFDRRNNDLFRYFDDFGRDFFRTNEDGAAPCRTDILDLGDRFQLRADMPGFRKEEIHIDIDGDRLTISAEHSQDTKQENETYLRRERRFGSLSRSFDISAVSAQNITASYENGVLQLELPKKSAQKPVAQRIEIR
ncbi:MAG: Hsp20/alpha crystallin family protein [Clostridiales bacterium]|nr:Hsp20/alpha crystallin family protein [Clostridiales bacterium]